MIFWEEYAGLQFTSEIDEWTTFQMTFWTLVPVIFEP